MSCLMGGAGGRAGRLDRGVAAEETGAQDFILKPIVHYYITISMSLNQINHI